MLLGMTNRCHSEWAKAQLWYARNPSTLDLQVFMSKQKTLFIALFLVSTLLIPTSSARAHANLVQANPEANAALERPPAQIEILFSEPLEASFSTIEVLDSEGLQVDVGDSKLDAADPTRLTVSLRSIPDGVYTVVWRVLSSVDGHVTSGAYPFSVGEVDAAALEAAAAASQTISLSLGEVAGRWLGYLGGGTVMGGLLFLLFVWQPVLKVQEQNIDLSERWKAALHIALLALLAGAIIMLLVQGGQVQGTELAAPWSDAVGNLLFTTRSGALWLARVAFVLVLVAILPWINEPRGKWGMVAASAALMLTTSIGSHAAAEAEPLVPVLLDWVHLVAASVWIGGLVFFVTALWSTLTVESGKTQSGVSGGGAALLLYCDCQRCGAVPDRHILSSAACGLI